MSRSLIKRIEAIERKASSDLVIYAETTDGQKTEGRVKDIISKSGELAEGYSGVGSSDMGLVKSGSSLKDLDRILKYIFEHAKQLCT